MLAAATSIRPITRGGMGLRQWARSPIKMTIDEFLAAIQEKIVADRVFDPIAVTQDRLGVIASYLGGGEMKKVKQSFPADMQNLFPALADAA